MFESTGSVVCDVPKVKAIQSAAGGVPCVVSVAGVLRSPFEARKLKLTLRHFLQRDAAVTLSLTALSSDGCPVQALQKFCEYLNTALPSNYKPGRLGLSLHSHQVPLQAYFLIANSVLGSGPRYVYLDSLQMRPHLNSAVRAETDRNWRFLWQQRLLPERLVPVYGGIVRSACPLLSDEVARSVLPETGGVVPQSSAWLPVTISLTTYTHGDGHIDWSRLSAAIARVVREGENMHDRVTWPCHLQRSDARLHRRLAISVTGLGNLVQESGRDPSHIDCLIWLTGIVKRIRNEMRAASVELAQQSGASPAVLRADPSIGLKAGAARDNWRSCWQAAVRTSALRHRNLLVLSPYSVLPDKIDHSVKFFDLLPVIRQADSWCFSTTASFATWRMEDYQRFHRCAWAQIQAHNEGCVVADGV
jgi:hypothetical protein